MAYGMLNACAMGMASGIMIVNVPQELPVANDTNAPNRKMKADTRTGENCILCIVSTMKSAVPKPLIILPSDHASTSVSVNAFSTIFSYKKSLGFPLRKPRDFHAFFVLFQALPRNLAGLMTAACAIAGSLQLQCLLQQQVGCAFFRGKRHKNVRL